MDKVKELIEWVTDGISVDQCARCGGNGDKCKECNQDHAELAKQILSHPDLALIDRDWYHKYKDGTADASIIPLAEALKKID